MSKYFPKPRPLGENVKVELVLFNYASKENLKNGRGVDTSAFAKKVDLAGLKSEINKLDIGKLETTPVDLSKISDIVKNRLKKLYMVNRLKIFMLFKPSMLAI